MAQALLTIGIAAALVLGVVLWRRSSAASRASVTVAEAEVSEKIREAEEALEVKLQAAKEDRVELKRIRKIRDSRKQRDELAAFANRHRPIGENDGEPEP